MRAAASLLAATLAATLRTVNGLPWPLPDDDMDSMLSSRRASSSARCCSRNPVRYDLILPTAGDWWRTVLPGSDAPQAKRVAQKRGRGAG